MIFTLGAPELMSLISAPGELSVAQELAGSTVGGAITVNTQRRATVRHLAHDLSAGPDSCDGATAALRAKFRNRVVIRFDAQFTRSYSLTTALAPFTLRVWLTICLWAELFV